MMPKANGELLKQSQNTHEHDDANGIERKKFDSRSITEQARPK